MDMWRREMYFWLSQEPQTSGASTLALILWRYGATAVLPWRAFVLRIMSDMRTGCGMGVLERNRREEGMVL